MCRGRAFNPANGVAHSASAASSQALGIEGVQLSLVFCALPLKATVAKPVNNKQKRKYSFGFLKLIGLQFSISALGSLVPGFSIIGKQLASNARVHRAAEW